MSWLALLSLAGLLVVTWLLSGSLAAVFTSLGTAVLMAVAVGWTYGCVLFPTGFDGCGWFGYAQPLALAAVSFLLAAGARTVRRGLRVGGASRHSPEE